MEKPDLSNLMQSFDDIDVGVGTLDTPHSAAKKTATVKTEKIKLTKAEKVAKLEEKRKQIQNRINKLLSRDNEKVRKADDRRKFLSGGFLLSLAAKGDENAKKIIESLVASLKLERDKALFAPTEKDQK
jgi:hypothetical protein